VGPIVYNVAKRPHDVPNLAICQIFHVEHNRWVDGGYDLHLLKGFLVNTQKVENPPQVLQKILARRVEHVPYIGFVIGVGYDKISAHIFSDRDDIIRPEIVPENVDS